MAGETVLVVDDRKDNLKFMREYVLEPNGYKMLEAENGLDALEIILSRKLDLIISDIMMPKMGGLELLEHLRQQGLDIPAILMTFHGSEETAVRAFRLGARDYVIKPFAIEEMLSTLDRALAESRLRQERDQLTQTLLKVNQQLEHRLQELRFLYGIGRSVTSLQSIEPILNRIVEAAVYLTKADEGSLMLLDADSGELYLRAARDMGEKKAKNFRVKVHDSIVGQVMRTGRPVMIGGMNRDDSFKVTTGYFVKALLNVPLKVSDRVIGVLAVNNKTTVRTFNEGHLQSLMALADYASVAIENARLYAKLASEANEATEEVEARTSELNDVNQQLLKTEKLAALGYMATGVSKAIDTPINVILSNLYQLKNEVTAQNRPLIASLAKEAFYCRQVMQNLLEFSGRKDYQAQQVNLNETIEEAWKTYTHKYDNPQIKFVREFDPQLPLISADSSQIKQALFYLIKNAYQAMSAGGTLHIITKNANSEILVIVKDTGTNISQKDIQHIFDPFYETNDKSYGMELSITNSIVTRHKGSIEAESKPGQGTTFIMHLPITKI